MPYNVHDVYFESNVLAADPIELVDMLYHACTASVRDAKSHLAGGRIAERSKAITKAYEILVELTASLDVARGGEIAQRLGLLYDYMQRRLMDANLQQSGAPLDEVLSLLSTLSEAWAGVRTAAAKPATSDLPAWAPPKATVHDSAGYQPGYQTGYQPGYQPASYVAGGYGPSASSWMQTPTETTVATPDVGGWAASSSAAAENPWHRVAVEPANLGYASPDQRLAEEAFGTAPHAWSL